MNLELSADALRWQGKAREFADDVLKPHEVAAELNNGELEPALRKKHKKLAIELGFSAMDVPKSHGGLQLSIVEQVAVWEQLEPSIAEIEAPIKRIDLEGYPPDLLPDYAHKVGADLVVVGTRGRGNFASLVLGSTSHRSIQVAGCDVLVVHPTTT